MKCPVNDAPLLQRTLLERHFLTLAILATSACACTVIIDATERDDMASIGSGSTALSGALDDDRYAPGPRTLRAGTKTKPASPISCGPTTSVSAGSAPDTL